MTKSCRRLAAVLATFLVVATGPSARGGTPEPPIFRNMRSQFILLRPVHLAPKIVPRDRRGTC